MSTNTIHKTASELREALIAYIEAAYHVADPNLLQQRRRLLETSGVIHQAPFLESTPRYMADGGFADDAEAGATKTVVNFAGVQH